MPRDAFTAPPWPEIGKKISENSVKSGLPLPGYNSKEVIIMQIIAANQLLRDQLIEARDAIVELQVVKRNLRLMDDVVNNLHNEGIVRDRRIIELINELDLANTKAKKKVARKKK